MPDDGLSGRTGTFVPDERAVFLLREAFELHFDEIATSVGITQANARQIRTRARGRLRESDPAAPCRLPNPRSRRIEPVSQAVFVDRLTLRETQKQRAPEP